MRREIYDHEKKFNNWLEKVEEERVIDGLSKRNSELVIYLIKDFRLGVNVSNHSKKGARCFHRLNALRQKITFVIRLIERNGIEDVTTIKPEELHKVFNDMREGVIKTRKGTPYKSVGDYVKSFKTFWHWYQRIARKQGNNILDITEDLDARGEKPKFVYFTQQDFEKIMEKASFDLKPLLALAFDSGIRVTELLNVKVSDFLNDFKELNIRDETAKTFGRRMKLMMCSNQIREYVLKLDLKPDNFLAQRSAPMINKELRKLGKEILNPEQIKYKNLTLYDFRHSSACFWLIRYKSESAMKYRFGWKKSEMIHYYTEFLGMKDTITQDDLYVDITKTELEKELQEEKKRREEIERRLRNIEITLMNKATQQNNPISLQTQSLNAIYSISGLSHDNLFKKRQDYENQH